MPRTLIAGVGWMVWVGGMIGCSNPPSNLTYGGGDFFEELEFDGRTRRYIVHVPPSVSAAEAAPLILVFHGAGQSAGTFQAFMGFDAVADRAGVVVAYVDGWRNIWAVGGTTTADQFGVDDLAFTSKVIDLVADGLNIDRRRVFAVGISNGALMVHRIGCQLSGKVAAIASVAATMLSNVAADCDPDDVSAMFVSGTEDEFFPWEGFSGFDNTLLSAEGTAARWAELLRCNSAPTVTAVPDTAADGTTVEQHTFEGCRDGARVEFYGVQGGGHTWPGVPSTLDVLGPTTLDFSASDAVVDFFLATPR